MLIAHDIMAIVNHYKWLMAHCIVITNTVIFCHLHSILSLNNTNTSNTHASRGQ